MKNEYTDPEDDYTDEDPEYGAPYKRDHDLYEEDYAQRFGKNHGSVDYFTESINNM